VPRLRPSTLRWLRRLAIAVGAAVAVLTFTAPAAPAVTGPGFYAMESVD
jgi:hypothetical protein